eukprot:1180657-Prorocentrum_minimum.AAC.2
MLVTFLVYLGVHLYGVLPYLSSGGVGSSGLGAYHGRNTIECFQGGATASQHEATNLPGRQHPLLPETVYPALKGAGR